MALADVTLPDLIDEWADTAPTPTPEQLHHLAWFVRGFRAQHLAEYEDEWVRKVLGMKEAKDGTR